MHKFIIVILTTFCLCKLAAVEIQQFPLDDSPMTKLQSADPLDHDEFITKVMDEERYRGNASVIMAEVDRRRELLVKTAPLLYPSMDLNFPLPLPKNFRITTDPYPSHSTKVPTREGLEKLRASASGQFLTGELYLMLMKLPQDKKVTILDLREESHGYVNSLPIAWRYAAMTWTNMHKTLDEIQKDEEMRLNQIYANKKVVIDPNTPVAWPLNVSSVSTEQELVKQFNLGYIRIPITENHSPKPATVDQMVELIRTLPENQWIHVHCHGGRGRTTTFLVMYDIIENGKKVSLDDILLRQNLIGGTDILKPLDPQDFRHDVLAQRVHFIKDFYVYATQNDLAKVKFSEWYAKRHSAKQEKRF